MTPVAVAVLVGFHVVQDAHGACPVAALHLLVLPHALHGAPQPRHVAALAVGPVNACTQPASLRLQTSQPCIIWASPASAACSPPLCSMPYARIESWHLDACNSGRIHVQVMLTHHLIWRPCTAADLSLRSRRAPGCCCGACWRNPSAGRPPLRGSAAPGGAPVCAAAAPATASCAHSRSGSAQAPAQHQTQLWPPPHGVMQGPLNSIQTRINGDC